MIAAQMITDLSDLPVQISRIRHNRQACFRLQFAFRSIAIQRV